MVYKYLCSHTTVPAGLMRHSHTQVRQKDWLCVLAPLSELCEVHIIRKIAQQRLQLHPDGIQLYGTVSNNKGHRW